VPVKSNKQRLPKITARQEGGDDGYCYVVRVDGRSYITGLHRSEVKYYKEQALSRWKEKNNYKEEA
jgi:hypothetical protein